MHEYEKIEQWLGFILPNLIFLILLPFLLLFTLFCMEMVTALFLATKSFIDELSWKNKAVWIYLFLVCFSLYILYKKRRFIRSTHPG